MIKFIEINHFKSLAEFQISMEKLTCLVGLNGAGKTSLLQAIDFLAHVVTGEVEKWLAEREWKPGEVLCRLPNFSNRRTIKYRIGILLEGHKVLLEGVYNADRMKCTSESVMIDNREVLAVLDNRYRLEPGVWEVVKFTYQGSILSQIQPTALERANLVLLQARTFFEKVKSLDLLAPHLMRLRARQGENIGRGGEKLSAFLHTLSLDAKIDLTGKLQGHFSPYLTSLATHSLKSGWKKLSMMERFPLFKSSNTVMETEARHMNDGLLRQLAIVAQTLTDDQFLLFDEIENGMNQEVVGHLVDLLRQSSQQIVFTTHNPLVLNFLTDEEARQSVVLLFRDKHGLTRSRKYFDLAITQEKLGTLGPGEVYADTSLEDVVRCANFEPY